MITSISSTIPSYSSWQLKQAEASAQQKEAIAKSAAQQYQLAKKELDIATTTAKAKQSEADRTQHDALRARQNIDATQLSNNFSQTQSASLTPTTTDAAQQWERVNQALDKKLTAYDQTANARTGNNINTQA